MVTTKKVTDSYFHKAKKLGRECDVLRNKRSDLLQCLHRANKLMKSQQQKAYKLRKALRNRFKHEKEVLDNIDVYAKVPSLPNVAQNQ